MLTRILLSLVLLFNGGVAAAEDKANSFCRGFIIKALDESTVEGESRIDLWLGWNATVTSTGSDGTFNESEYQQGRDRFDDRLASGGASAVLEVRNEDCDMGRNDGWVWW